MLEQSGRLLVPKRAGEQLVDERRLVGGLARGVEDRLVGAARPRRWSADQRERVVPGDRLVVGGAGAQHHRLGEPALLAQPVVGALRELGDRVRGEELRADAAQGGLLGDRLGAVLAELGGVPVLRVGVGPGAALAVEAVDLVELEQGLRGAARRPSARRPASSRPRPRSTPAAACLGSLDLEVGLVDVVVRCASAHVPILLASPRGRTRRAEGQELENTAGCRRRRAARGPPRSRRTPGPRPRGRPRRARAARTCRP